jgi:diguanylate cyclase (GGDEF)-like protein/PAS domain S-box-containing protein
MALVSGEGHLIQANGAFGRLLGRDPAGLPHLGFCELLHPDQRQEIQRLLAELAAGARERLQVECHFLQADGQPPLGRQLSFLPLRGQGASLVLVHRAEPQPQPGPLLEPGADVGCHFDREGRIAWLSASVERCLGWRPEQLLGQGLEALTAADHHPSLATLRTLDPGGVHLDLPLRHADGHSCWMRVTARPFPAGEGSGEEDAGGWISGWRDIQAEVTLRHQLERALHTDPLTGLICRSALLSLVEAALARPTTAILSIGIDRLSPLNNALTHRAGDLLIATVARRLGQALPRPEHLARGTGDTFIVLLDAVESADGASAVAEALRQAVKGPLTFEGHTINPTVSIGLAVAQRDLAGDLAPLPTADELLRDAHLAMRAAAKRGRDRCEFADHGLALRAQRSLVLQQELRTAVEGGELQAWYMPVVDLSSGGLRGYEALVRWPRADGRLEMPDTFLPIARSCQLGEAIDLQVLRQGITTLAALPPPLTVAVNLCAETLAQEHLVEVVQHWLEEAQVAPGRLHLEITETALLNLGTVVTTTIRRLAALGVRWLVDDFGTGYSSISHLRDLPIHGLKLDCSFTTGLRAGDQKSVRLAQALAGLAEGLGLETVAEGIESADEALSLRDLGWSCGQGWFFGKAAPLLHGQPRPLPRLGLDAGLLRPPAPTGSSRSSWALAVTDNVPVGLFALRPDADGTPQFLFVSRRWLAMLRLQRRQILGGFAPILARVHRHDRAGLIAHWHRQRAGAAPLSWEGRLLIGATTTWVLVEAAPLTQVDGSLIWQGVISDITERKRQELRLRRLLDEAPIAMAINELRGDDPRITYVNQQFIHSFGYDLDTIPNLSHWARLAYPDPRQRQLVFQAWDAGVARARSSNGVVEPIEAKVTAADGSVRDALFSAVLLDDELVLSVLDITEWRLAERQLREARASLAENALAITEAIPVGTYTMVQPPMGGMASFSFMSQRFLQICGLNREEAAADPLKAFACVHPDDYDEWVRLNSEAFTHKQAFYAECRVLVEGEVRWISAESVPRDLADGSTVWEGVLTDITKQHQALEQLQQERTLLTTVLEHIDAQVYMKDRQGRYLYANSSAEKYLMQGTGSVIGRTDLELLPADVAAAFRAVDDQVFRHGGPLRHEERLPHPHGGERIFLSEKMLYRQPGQPDCLIGFSTEITQLRQATAQLAASEEHYRLLAENSSDVVMRVDSEGRILWVSPSLTPALGWQPEEFLGKLGSEFLLHGGEAGHYRSNLKTLSTGDAKADGVLARDQVRAKDGTIHWAETHASPYRNASGEVEGIVASFRLIDQAVAAEEELRRSEERYRLLAENARDVIWTLEPDGRISYVSPSIQLLRGLTPEEAMRQPLEQTHPPASLRRSQAYFQQLLADAQAGLPLQPFRNELEYYCADGSTIWTDVIALPMVDDQGRLQKLLGVSRDITERKHYERQLMAANRRLQELATTDGLTGIWNRRHLEASIHQAIERSQRSGNPLALILCDIDTFKAINDRHGHPVGDQVLIAFSRLIQQQLRSTDCFGRWGGEEFLILLEPSDARSARLLAEQLRQLVAATPFPPVGTVTASFGVAQRLEHESPVAWFQRVDNCVYAAKKAGRNQIWMA